jgi:hypothetical protein
MNSKFSFLIDLIIFKIAWVLCVLATKTPIPQLAPLLGIILVVGRAWMADRLKPSLPLALSALLIGIIGDAILVKVNLLEFPPYPNLGGTPLWMVSLWVCFGIMLRPVFEWFLDHCMRSIIGFSLGGVIAYWSGQQLGVLEFTNSWITALGIAVEWAIAGLIFRFLHLKFPTHSENEHS